MVLKLAFANACLMSDGLAFNRRTMGSLASGVHGNITKEAVRATVHGGSFEVRAQSVRGRNLRTTDPSRWNWPENRRKGRKRRLAKKKNRIEGVARDVPSSKAQ